MTLGSLTWNLIGLNLKTNKPVYIKQYPLSKHKEQGIQHLIENFVKQGVLEQTHSPYNTPIDPVMKADGKTWRLTQDLRAVNQLIIPLAPIVPDVLTVMNSVPHSHKYFTVIDLCSAFFSVPVHPDTQPLLIFTFKGQQYSWKRLAQGYVDSPAVFSAAVHRTLAKMIDLPSSVCVLEFADDILVSGETEEDCVKASVIVCNVLAETGFKASKEHDRHLRGLIDHKAPPNTALEWTAEADEHFNASKAAITTPPALDLPDYTKPFHLHVRETVGAALGVLLQLHGSTYRPVACLRAVAAAALIVQMAEKTVLSHPLILYASHQVGAILHNIQTQHMTAQRRSGYVATLLAMKKLSIQTTANINPALLGILGMVDMADFNVEHDCIFELTTSYSSRFDLLDTHLDGGEHIYVDGSCSKPSDGVYLCGYAVVSDSGEDKKSL
ncbi:scavenger receptor class A member 5 isoform X3 [Triplophysa dalaica]|uniref:scavenger receptor class A member 5 isoform X3 n=1 Tax=Triplophysa dalaica TaxID=1582913 RepID=UPI0024DF838F|nr:scavenger receptor class A member 5 isoform X3 [Triplophysa dalaica]